MSVMSELAYDIEQLYIEGYSPKTIALMLDCPVEIVYDWLDEMHVVADQTASEADEYYGA